MQRSWLAGRTTAINSTVSGYIDEGTSYLKLKEINDDLVAQNKALMLELYGTDSMQIARQRNISETRGNQTQRYQIIDGEVVYNSINRRDNYFTINRGRKHGIDQGMGVIAPKGIAGIVVNTTNDYALVQSVLSANKIKINAALKASGYFGTLTWRGGNARIMNLGEVPKYVPLQVGDTVITDGKSAIFPEGIMVGKVAGYQVDQKTGFWDISVELSETMGNIKKVYIVKNLKKAELQKIGDTLQSAMDKDE